jgi:GMP reductase
MPRIETEVKLDFKDVLFRPKRSTLSSRSQVDLVREFEFKNSKQRWSGVPLIAANMDTTGTFEMAASLSKHRCMTAMHKYYDVDGWKDFAAASPDALPYAAVSAGTSAADFSVVTGVVDAVPGVQTICLDVANGYSEAFVDAVRKYREAFPRHTLYAGNVVTGEMVEELLLTGADVIKVGIGPGSVCTTRKQTGVGYPQFSAVLECADAAHGLNGHVISDGGCTCPGDVAKAFGAGADFVMLGGMLAGHSESGGELVTRNGTQYKLFYGMSSATSMKKHAGGVAEYRASEGKCVELPYRGPVEATMLEILGGVRSTCTYVGAAKLKELPKRATFIRVSAQLNESLSSLKTDVSHGYTKLAGAGAGAPASAPEPILVSAGGDAAGALPAPL